MISSSRKGRDDSLFLGINETCLSFEGPVPLASKELLSAFRWNHYKTRWKTRHCFYREYNYEKAPKHFFPRPELDVNLPHSCTTSEL